MFIAVDTYTVARPIKIKGRQYLAGETISPAEIADIRGVDGLLSRKWIIPTPDPHGRKTLPEKPTIISTPASWRKQMAGLREGTIAVTYDPDPGDELRVTFDTSFPGPSMWNYGDGGGSIQGDSHTTRTYGAPGTYQVTAISSTHQGTVSVTVPQAMEDEPAAANATSTRRARRKPANGG